MKLNHLDLSVPDLDAAIDFFVAGFNFTVMVKREADGMAVLRGDDGFGLVLTRDAAPQYPPAFHIGFLQPSARAVTEAYERIVAAGIAPLGEPALSFGAMLFYCRVPGGVLVEVSHRA
jgi:catechol 2,3-dioxygenase-like lactoylglutathione lyase family enzyme